MMGQILLLIQGLYIKRGKRVADVHHVEDVDAGPDAPAVSTHAAPMKAVVI